MDRTLGICAHTSPRFIESTSTITKQTRQDRKKERKERKEKRRKRTKISPPCYCTAFNCSCSCSCYGYYKKNPWYQSIKYSIRREEKNPTLSSCPFLLFPPLSIPSLHSDKEMTTTIPTLRHHGLSLILCAVCFRPVESGICVCVCVCVCEAGLRCFLQLRLDVSLALSVALGWRGA